MKTSDFFPFLFKKISDFNDDFAFREVLNETTNKMELIPITNSLIERVHEPLSPKIMDGCTMMFTGARRERERAAAG